MPVLSSTSVMENKAKAKQHNLTTQLGPQQMVHWFVASSYASGSFTEERVRNSVALLHRVPAARYAVLHRFTMLFEEAIRSQLDQMEFQTNAPGINQEIAASLDLVVTTLLGLLKDNGEAWAPILCTWSVESLGQISGCYKGRQIVPPPNNLPRLLIFWLNTVGMRMLLDVYRTCLKILIEHSPESCVDSLLTASSNHSPYFDWVVADVGNAFPAAIIDRVLSSGFNKFCKIRWSPMTMTPSSSITINENEQSILSSVIRVLEHLISHHKKKICDKMLEIFKRPPGEKENGKVKAAFFLMTLFSTSLPLLRATTLTFVDEINTHTLNALFKEFRKLSRGAEEMDSLCSLVVHLVCQSGSGSYELMNLFVEAASNDSKTFKNLDSSVKDVFARILPSVLKDLHHLSLSKGLGENHENRNALHELSENYKAICNDVITTSSQQRRTWLNSLLLSICYHGRSVYVLSHLLIESTSPSHLKVFLNLYDEVQPLTAELLERVVTKSFHLIKKLGIEKRKNFLQNIYHLISQNGSALVSEAFISRMKKSLCLSIDDLVTMLGSLSSSMDLCSVVIQILFLLMSSITSSKFRLRTRLLPMTRTIVFYFFKLLHEGYVNNDQSMQNCHRTLVELSQSHELFEVVCRFLLEASVTNDNSILFGRRIEPEFGEENCQDLCSEHHVSLLSLHRKLSSKATSRRSVGGFIPISVETGLIGTGPKKKKKCPMTKVLMLPRTTLRSGWRAVNLWSHHPRHADLLLRSDDEGWAVAAQRSNNECLSLLIYRCCCKTGGGADVSQISIPDVTHAFDSDKLYLLSDCLTSAIIAASPYLATAIALDGNTEWPACHMRKFTIERDLKVFHFLDEHPFVWQLLFLVAHNYRAIWNLSPITRSCISVLLSHFESSRYNDLHTESSLHHQFAVRVVQLAGKGQLLPAPLAYVSEMFGAINQYEIFVLLTVVWNFIKDHPPSVDIENIAKEERDFNEEKINLQPYLVTVHNVLHANIDKLGYLFSRFTIAQ